MPWASSRRAEAWPGGNSQPSTAREGAKDHCSFVGAGRDWGAVRLNSEPPEGDAILASSGREPWEEAEPFPSLGPSSKHGSESTHPSAPALALVRPPPSRGSSGRPPWPPMGLRCHGELGSPACLSSTKRPWQHQRPPPPPTRDGSMCQAGRRFLLDGRGPSAAVIRALRGASVSTVLHHPDTPEA